MSLLHQETAEDIDVAALGEEFTKDSSNVFWAGVIAAVLVTVVVAVVVLASHKPPVVSGEIVQVWAYPEHGETSGTDANGDAKSQESFDQVLLFAHVKLHNQSNVPLVVQDVLANVRLADGVPLSVSAGSVAQFEEAFLAYPKLDASHGKPLAHHTVLDPGQSVDGTAFWVFRLTKQQWNARKDWQPDPNHSDPGSKSGLNFTFSIQYQQDLVLAPHTAVMEE
jgi:hypothetical protein